jgi:hypothetical protein
MILPLFKRRTMENKKQEKNKKYINLSLSKELIQLLEQTSRKLGLPVSSVVRNSIVQYCRQELKTDLREVFEDDY